MRYVPNVLKSSKGPLRETYCPRFPDEEAKIKKGKNNISEVTQPLLSSREKSETLILLL